MGFLGLECLGSRLLRLLPGDHFGRGHGRRRCKTLPHLLGDRLALLAGRLPLVLGLLPLLPGLLRLCLLRFLLPLLPRHLARH